MLMEAHEALPAAPPPMQSAQKRLPGASSSCFKAASCFSFISIVTPFVSPAFLPIQNLTFEVFHVWEPGSGSRYWHYRLFVLLESSQWD